VRQAECRQGQLQGHRSGCDGGDRDLSLRVERRGQARLELRQQRTRVGVAALPIDASQPRHQHLGIGQVGDQYVQFGHGAASGR